MSLILQDHAAQSVIHADKAIALLNMSRLIHEDRGNDLIDKATVRETVYRLNIKAVAEIDESLRLQKLAISEQKPH